MWKKYKYKDMEMTRVPKDYLAFPANNLYVYLGDGNYLSVDGKKEHRSSNGWFKTKKKAKEAIDKYLKSMGMDIYYAG